jgi:hypothetical protein
MLDDGTKVISPSDALTRIEELEARVEALQVMAAEAFSALDSLEVRLSSTTQVAEGA